MKHVRFFLLGICGFLTSCGLEPVEWQRPDEGRSAMPVAIDPLISRVTGTSFDTNDRIGLTIWEEGELYCENRELTYNGTTFTSTGFIWYDNINHKADLTAYYPYQADGVPTNFSIASNQSGAGYVASDLLAATKEEVTPSSSPVSMTFYHLLSKISISLTNNSLAGVLSVSLGGSRPTATIDWSGKQATVKSSSSPVEITPYTLRAGERYEAIVVPQEVILTLTVSTDNGKTHTHTMVETELLGGKLYTLDVTLTDIDLSASLSAEIKDWENGGAIEESGSTGDAGSGVESGSDNSADNGHENTTGNVLNYGGAAYAIETLADGRVWMVENLRYNPAEGDSLAAGVHYPGESLSSEEEIATYGLLYTAAVALGTEEITSENASTLEGAQGICPEGWHVPTEGEYKALFAAYSGGMPAALLFETPYWYASDYVANPDGGILLTSTPTSAAKSSKIQVALFYSDGTTSTTNKSNTNAWPVRCIRNQ